MPRTGRFVRVALGLVATAATMASAQPPGPEVAKALKFRYIGPVGNRVIAVAGRAGQPLRLLRGRRVRRHLQDHRRRRDTGRPIFDDQDVSSIGSLAVAPSDPNVVWAGTGESFIRSNISIGNGIYRSTDAGKTVDPAWVSSRPGASAGWSSTPRTPTWCSPARSVTPMVRSRSAASSARATAGRRGRRTLFVDENTGCSDIAIDPNNPRVLFAGMWQLEIHTWGRTSGGPGSGLFKSTDGGATWKRLAGHGLPESPVGKIAAQVAPQQLQPRLRAHRNRRRHAWPTTARRRRADRSGGARTAARTGSW